MLSWVRVSGAFGGVDDFWAAGGGYLIVPILEAKDGEFIKKGCRLYVPPRGGGAPGYWRRWNASEVRDPIGLAKREAGRLCSAYAANIQPSRFPDIAPYYRPGITVKCTTCGALPSRGCRTAHGRYCTRSHTARVKAETRHVAQT